jgi:hypothetical protein
MNTILVSPLISPVKSGDYWRKAWRGLFLIPWWKRGDVPPTHLLPWKYPKNLFPETIFNPCHHIFHWFRHQYQWWNHYRIQFIYIVMSDSHSLVNSSCLAYLPNWWPGRKLTIYLFSVSIYHKRGKSVVAAFPTSWCISSPESCCIWPSDFLTPSTLSGEETVERWGKWSDKDVFMGFWVPRKWSKSTTPPPAGKIWRPSGNAKFYSSFGPWPGNSSG